jgi:acetoin utilization deacetylase AcuC-like enzyme
MRAFYSDQHTFPLPIRHPFPGGKYSGLRAALEAAPHGERLELVPAPPAKPSELALAHDEAYLERASNSGLTAQEERRLGLPWSPALYERAVHAVGGTIAACRAALTDAVAVNLGGGTHHAGRATPAGFCLLNDVVVALRTLQREGLVTRAAVIDCDVHQGDGTAELTSGDPSIFAFSIHGANNFPFHKKRSDLDVALPNDTSDDAYLAALEPALTTTLDRSRADLAVYLAGADPFAGDRWGRLALTKTGLAERDRMVLAACAERSLPVAVTMAGGYARDIDDVVDINMATVEIALARAKR